MNLTLIKCCLLFPGSCECDSLSPTGSMIFLQTIAAETGMDLTGAYEFFEVQSSSLDLPCNTGYGILPCVLLPDGNIFVASSDDFGKKIG